MTPLVPLTLFGWIPFLLLLFALLPARRAAIVGFLAAWLFLPEAGYAISGFPNYTKVSATTGGILLATLLYDPNRLTRFRPSWIDLPVAVFCLSVIPSSIANGLGIYDGLSGALNWVMLWGLPYFIGRLYFTDLAELRELAIGMFLGGLVYVPLCLWEIRMSPQLHAQLYGFSPSAFHNALRFGGFRPKVFLHSGLPLGLWMTTASLAAVWLWRAGDLKRLGDYRTGWFVALLVVTTVLCKSMGALVLLLVGLVVLTAARHTRWRWIPLLLPLLVPVYMTARTAGWYPESWVQLAGWISTDRASSLQFRLDNEGPLIEHALGRPVFGWGRWGRNRVVDEITGEDLAVTDSLWVVYLGQYGLVGLTAFSAMLLLPALLTFWRLPPALWGDPRCAAPVALAMLPLLYAMDCLVNGMANPIFMLAGGAVSGFLVATGQQRRRRAPREPATATHRVSSRAGSHMPTPAPGYGPGGG